MTIEKIDFFPGIGFFFEKVLEAAEELGMNVHGQTISNGDSSYKTQTKKEDEHEYGVGGHRLNYAALVRTNGSKVSVLESRDYAAWDTLMDDSEDYTSAREKVTRLQLEDRLARAVFEKIKRHSESTPEK